MMMMMTDRKTFTMIFCLSMHSHTHKHRQNIDDNHSKQDLTYLLIQRWTDGKIHLMMMMITNTVYIVEWLETFEFEFECFLSLSLSLLLSFYYYYSILITECNDDYIVGICCFFLFITKFWNKKKWWIRFISFQSDSNLKKKKKNEWKKNKVRHVFFS